MKFELLVVSLEKLSNAALILLDNHHEILGETCKQCLPQEKTCAENLRLLAERFKDAVKALKGEE